ncbi:SDR family NAD(P)-dependent oxidoreductase [Phyllobacterium endophyticum]|uniref:Protein CapI n=1 Tax=Phyllobacterium endophyticum TaxID=1149773 RepID=A0A2P7B1L7_9HYPH|nr:SDR family NAD(P)-dependent oxidoreductase [Phyllobacterium endophyticum]MBB3237944.1 UDP-glucuronate 4-epimerase [Phyllobacterium endophyticum]PSH60369.1 protein CapI [Phyllobacterium endophyticum]TYR42546.1 SDR family NAD(P)-dependent oxidoreductase [Phyllobacterium endophyticum]
MKAIVTGAAGFIGFHVAKRLASEGFDVIAVDNLNDYYPVALKEARLSALTGDANVQFHRANIADPEQLSDAIEHGADADVIVHLAAQAGVRYSVENPAAYVDANVHGQVAIFERALKMRKRPPVVYASSSSVYGANKKVPFSESDPVDHPVSVYAATKRSAELLAHSYRHVHNLASTGLRFFTVYGPYGRPDMAPWLFTDAIFQGEPIKVYNHGDMQRDFTFIDDIVDGVFGAVNRILTNPGGTAPIYNLGNNKPVALMRFIEIIEEACGRSAIKRFEPMPPADVKCTYADIDLAARDLGFSPSTALEEGIPLFVEWFRGYNGR